MNVEQFKNIIFQEYTNKLLNKEEIMEICKKAITYKILDEQDISISEISECTTEDLIKHIRKCRNSYLTSSVPLHDQSFLSAKYHSPLSQDKTKSPFYNHKQEIVKNNSVYNSPFINKNNNLENPFTNDEDLVSFCEDLRSKTNQIVYAKEKNKINLKSKEKTKKIVNDVIESFIHFRIKKEKSRTKIYFIVLLLLCIVFYIFYKPMAV